MNQTRTETLADALPREINRVRELQNQYREIGKLPNVMVGPQIAMMEQDIRKAIDATVKQDTVAMLEAYKSLQGWEE